MNNYFYIVEDGGVLAQILTSHLIMMLPINYKIVSVVSCADVQAKPGDIILCDQNGVYLEQLRPNGATVITMTGDTSLKVDLYKPFSFMDLKKKINEKTGMFNKSETIKKEDFKRVA